MKKVLLYNFAINFSVWFLIYFITAFVRWYFHNPFQWIIDIPKYTYGDRFLIIFYLLIWQGIQVFILYKNILKYKK